MRRDTAVIWDFDGTLVDSHPRNLSVNRTIITELTGKPADAFPALASLEAYELAVARAGNWRDFYAREFGLPSSDVERAGELWPILQGSDPTPQAPFEGVRDALEALSWTPHGILSQNDRVVITAALETAGLLSHFGPIIGHGELERHDQKPAPGGLLRCIEDLDLEADAVVYFVGDHVTDAICAEAAKASLRRAGSALTVVSVGAFFGDGVHPEWDVEPDRTVRYPEEVIGLVQKR